ncbi:MAG: metallophosphoesterase family protein [Lentisphaerae bacterium]|nr:metallophosphoesterase family protein [Lentisphaerota bacterium]
MNARKCAILGDIHGNLEALEAVLEDARQQGVEAYVCVGDMVGYNANPAECLAKVRALGAVTVRGNHDHYCAHNESLDDFHPLAANVVDWTRRQLSADEIEYLRNLRLVCAANGFTVVHSTLDMPEKWGYVFDCLDADANFNYQPTSVCFHGHTHVPVVYEKQSRVTRLKETKVRVTLGRKYFVNTGSVGQPRDGDPRASYVTYDMERGEIDIRRVAYDIQAAQKKIRAVGLPDRLAQRLEIGR